MSNTTSKTHVITLNHKLPTHRNAKNFKDGCGPYLQITNPHDGI